MDISWGKKVLSILLPFCVVVAGLNVPSVQAAPSDLSVEWSTTDIRTVSGVFTIAASADTSSITTAEIKKWCLTVDGSPVTTNVAVRGDYRDSWYKAVFDADTGCWSRYSIYYPLPSGTFQWDSTAWPNGSHTYVITVTDTSNRTATSPTLNVLVANGGPSVEWSTTDNRTVSGVFTVAASAWAASTGTAEIKNWCLTVDGSPVTTNVAVRGDYRDSWYKAVFDADTGCWSRYSIYYPLPSGTFQWDSTAWPNGSHTYVITVTDTSNRTATSPTLNVSVANGGPSVEWSTTDNRTVSGVFTVAASAWAASTGTAEIKNWCLTVDGSPVTTNVAVTGDRDSWDLALFDADTGCWSRYSIYYPLPSGTFQWDSTAWPNGSHTYVITVTDTSNRTATSPTLTLTSVDPPLAPSPAPSTPAVSWSEPMDKSVAGIFTLSARALGSTTPASSIKKWCLTVDGIKVTSNVAVREYPDMWHYATFNADTGCWSSSSSNLTSGSFQWDSTAWANGSHTYAITVTDTSNRTATSPTLTVTVANTAPSVEWSTTDNGTVSGVFTVAASARAASTGTATIKKWCLTVDGIKVTSNVAVREYPDMWHYATFNADTGCWSSSSSNLTSGSFQWDSTAWANGSHTYAITVTDTSNRTATSPTLTVTVANTAPSVEWSTADNRTVSGVFTVAASARAASTGTATIKKWCLTVDGSPLKRGTASVDYRTFDARTGCWSRDSSDYTSSWAVFSFRTAAWTNASRVLKIVVTDTSNRTATDSLTFTTNNPQPTTKVIDPTAGEIVDGSATFGLRVYHPGANSITSWCIRIKTTSCSSNVRVSTSGETATRTSTGTVSFDTSLWRNGSYSARFTATDSEGRLFDSGSISFKSKNLGASATVPRITNGDPEWSDKTVDVEITTSSKNATKLFLYLGTSKTQLWKYAISPTDPSELFSLKPKTVYYVKVEAVGPNGTSETALVTFTSPSIPPPPPPPSGGGGGGGGGYSWSFFRGWNLEDYQDTYGYDPATFDCTGGGRDNNWSRNWWIVGIRNGAFAISKSGSSCS